MWPSWTAWKPLNHLHNELQVFAQKMVRRSTNTFRPLLQWSHPLHSCWQSCHMCAPCFSTHAQQSVQWNWCFHRLIENIWAIFFSNHLFQSNHSIYTADRKKLLTCWLKVWQFTASLCCLFGILSVCQQFDLSLWTHFFSHIPSTVSL